MTEEIVKSLFLTVISLLNLVTNAGLLVVLNRSQKLRDDVTNLLLIGLNAAYLMQGFTFGTTSTVLSWLGSKNETLPLGLKRFHACSISATRMASLNLVASLALVKMITIVKPLRATDLITKRRIQITLATVCSVPTLLSLASLAEPVVFSFRLKGTTYAKRGMSIRLMTVQTIFSLIVFLVSYVTIFACVVRQVIKTRTLVLPDGETAPENPVLVAFRSARGIVALCTAYMVFYIPTLINAQGPNGTNRQIQFALVWMSYCISFVNAFVFVAFCKATRIEVKRLWRLLTRQDTNRVGTDPTEDV